MLSLQTMHVPLDGFTMVKKKEKMKNKMKELDRESCIDIILIALDGYAHNDLVNGMIPVHITGITTEKMQTQDVPAYHDCKVTYILDTYRFGVATDLQNLNEISPLWIRESTERTRCRMAHEIRYKIESILANDKKFLVYTTIYANGFQIEINEFR